MSSASSSNPSPAPSPAPDSTSSSNPAATTAADLKRAHRAAKKAEQNARKEERKRIALETGVDPALLPQSLAGEFALKGGKEVKGFQPRGWVDVPVRQKREREEGGEDVKEVEGKKVKILSWNMLAQALVRRELFPGSDYLKGKDRLPALMQEVTYYSPDIAVLQEVDRLSEHLPSLTLTHGYTSFVGYRNKSHGLIIAHKQKVFNKVGERGIRLDDLPIDDSGEFSTAPSRIATPGAGEGERVATPASAEGEGLVSPASASSASPAAPDADKPAAPEKPKTEKEKEIEARPPDAPSETLKASRRAAGISRVTRNVGLFVALEFKDEPGRGVIVGTTHLFWAGEYVYERTRQVGLLMREAKRFREEKEEWRDWPIFLAGDLNTQPFELTYRLALSPSAPIPDALLSDFERSRVVHHSVEKLYNPAFEPPTPPAAEAKEGDNEDFDDPTAVRDKPIKNSRPGTVEEDGIVDLDALRRLFSPDGQDGEGVRSAYGEAYGLCEGEQRRWYGERPPGVQAGNGWKNAEGEEEKQKRREGTWEERVARGDFEPIYTNFTPLWRCTLDYIFLIPPSPSASPAVRTPQWHSLLQMHDFSDTCEPGLPRMGIEPSDHVAIGAVVEV